jgi:hypothetical protein
MNGQGRIPLPACSRCPPATTQASGRARRDYATLRCRLLVHRQAAPAPRWRSPHPEDVEIRVAPVEARIGSAGSCWRSPHPEDVEIRVASPEALNRVPSTAVDHLPGLGTQKEGSPPRGFESGVADFCRRIGLPHPSLRSHGPLPVQGHRSGASTSVEVHTRLTSSALFNRRCGSPEVEMIKRAFARERHRGSGCDTQGAQ